MITVFLFAPSMHIVAWLKFAIVMRPFHWSLAVCSLVISCSMVCVSVRVYDCCLLCNSSTGLSKETFVRPASKWFIKGTKVFNKWFFIQKVSFLESPPLSDKSCGKNALPSHCYSSSLVNMAFFTLKKNNLSLSINLFAFQMEYIRIINHKRKAMNQNCHLNTSYIFFPQYSLKWLLHENESSDNQHKGLI